MGGTFTDFTVFDARRNRLRHFKVPSTPREPAAAMGEGFGHILRTWGIDPASIGFVGHGTTVATNMVIERRGVKTGLLTTRGMRDVLEIGRQVRPNLYDYTDVKTEPLVPRALRFEVVERLDASGAVVTPLDPDSLDRAIDGLQRAAVGAVAICFLHSYRNPAHERLAAARLRERLPDVFLSVSSRILPEFREYERLSTTVINAYVGPRMAAGGDRLRTGMAGFGVGATPLTVHSNGGLMSPGTVRRHPVRTCLSGPAAGVVGASVVGRAAGVRNLITFDVGGTSTDVSLVCDGRPAFAASRLVAGHPVRTPMVDVHVVGAGGGSIARVDAAGGLRVGPRSAGADPGPVACGRGGRAVTLTDAHIVLQRLNPAGLLQGRLPVDVAAARRAIRAQIARPLGLGVEEAAAGIVRVAVASMSRAIRAVSTGQGHDVEGFALMAFGGAGPLHAVEVAAESGVPTVIVPEAPGTMCARGILLSDISFDFVRSILVRHDAAGWRRVVAAFDAMTRQARRWLAREGIAPGQQAIEAVIEARYRGQNHEVPVPVPVPVPAVTAEGMADFAAAFARAHRQAYGYAIDGRAVEIVNGRLKAIGRVPPLPKPDLVPGRTVGAARTGSRPVWFGSAWRETAILDRDRLGPGMVIEGPAIIEEMSATTPLAAGQCAMVDDDGNLHVEV